MDFYCVVSIASPNPVGSVAAVKVVIAWPTIHQIVSCVTGDSIVTGSSEQHLFERLLYITVNSVISGATGGKITISSGIVISCDDIVISSVSKESIDTVVTVDAIVSL